MFRPLWTVPLSGFSLSKLNEMGCFYWEDLWQQDTNELKPFVCEILHSSRDFSNQDFVTLGLPPPTLSSFDLYMKDNDDVVSFSKAIDELFGYGFPMQSVIELCGAPGVGKTQICLQLCSSVQIPKSLGGLSSSAIYIDTNKNFFFERYKEICLGTISHCKKVIQKLGLGPTAEEEMKTFTLENVDQSIHLFFIMGHIQLLACIQLLEKTIINNQAKLVIIDNFTFPFHEIDPGIERTSFICRTLETLQQLATKYQLAVVLTNELTTHINHATGETDIMPALGGSFAQFVTHRLLIGNGTAMLSKSPNRPSAVAKFKITNDGIRDMS